MRTHPLTAERIADIRNRVEQLPHAEVADSTEFQYVQVKLRAMEGSPQQAVAWFNEVLQEKKYSNEAAQHYGLAQAYVRAYALESAQQEVVWLRAHAPRHPMLESLAAHVEFLRGNLHEAETEYQRALADFPGHRGLIYDYAATLLAGGRPDAALKLLGNKQSLYPNDAHLYELQSQAYTQQGLNMQRHQAQGEAYFRSYNLPAAIEQMELALKYGNGDFYQMSIVEARLKQMRQLLGDPKDRK